MGNKESSSARESGYAKLDIHDEMQESGKGECGFARSGWSAMALRACVRYPWQIVIPWLTGVYI